MSAVACFDDASQASVLLELPGSPNVLPATEAQLSEPRSSDASIVLEVGERQFKTRVLSLTGESSFFASMFSGRWPGTLSSEGGSIFVDADPDLFQHILRYLRRGVFPIFWNRNGGFDYGLYAGLLQEARYFGINRLQDWIAQSKYLQAVIMQHSVSGLEGSAGCLNSAECNANLGSHVERVHYPSWTTVQRYRCPRNIFIHHGDPNRCGRACEKAKIDGVSDFEDVEVLHTLIVDKKTMLNPDVCLVGGGVVPIALNRHRKIVGKPDSMTTISLIFCSLVEFMLLD